VRISTTLFFLFGLNLLLSAQETITLMNGEILNVHSVLETDGMITVSAPKRFSSKLKTTALNKSEVFSYVHDGKEVVLYVQDSAFGDVYSADEMRMYLAGERDARANYKANHIALIGYLICGAASLVVGDGLLVLVVPPVAYGTLQLLGKVKIREKYISDKNYKFNDVYAEGFEPPARSKKIIKGIAGGVLGSVNGLITYLLKNQ